MESHIYVTVTYSMTLPDTFFYKFYRTWFFYKCKSKKKKHILLKKIYSFPNEIPQ
jgi:hypothetical protein